MRIKAALLSCGAACAENSPGDGCEVCVACGTSCNLQCFPCSDNTGAFIYVLCFYRGERKIVCSVAAEKPLFVNTELFSAHICLGKVHYMFYTKSLGMKKVLVSQEQQRVLQLPVGYERALCRCLHISWVLCALNDRIQLSAAFHTAFLSKHALELNLNYRERSLPLCSLSKCHLC